VTQNENPDLKWESTSMANIGIDFAFLKNRISGTIEVYDKQTRDLIWYYPCESSPISLSLPVGKCGRNK